MKNKAINFFIDKYSMGGPGIGSLGSGFGGANTNKGITPLPSDHHEKSIEDIKKWFLNKQKNK